MAAILVFDKCLDTDDPEAVSERDAEDLFEYEGGSFVKYIRSVNNSNLEGEYFAPEDVDRSVYIIDDGGEAFRLKDGTYINVCWRAGQCHVWPEDDEELITLYNKLLKK